MMTANLETNPVLDTQSCLEFDRFALATGARILEWPFNFHENNGEFDLERNEIRIRERSQWSARPVGYYDTLAHELIHWTGPQLGWDLTGEAGSENHAIEELIAITGGIILTKQFGVYAPRPSHSEVVSRLMSICSDQVKAVQFVELEAERDAKFLLGVAGREASS